jgi:hypothetical protein
MNRMNLVVIISAVVLLLYVLEQVRRRRLREEYSWLWLLTATGYLLVAVWPSLSIWMVQVLDSSEPHAAFAFVGLFFLILISIQYSTELSRLKTQSKDLAQQLAILDSELQGLTEASLSDPSLGQSMAIRQLFGEQARLSDRVADLSEELRRMGQDRSDAGRIGGRLEKQASAERPDR